MLRARFLVFVFLAVGGFAAGAEPPPAAVRVRIPPEKDAENFRLGVGIYGHGLQTGAQSGETGVCEYDVPCATAEVVKLFAYLPGYRIDPVDGLRAGDVWEPFFVPLDVLPLEGKLLDSHGRPLAGETLVFTYDLIEAMDYFGYSDGGAPRLPVATARTQTDGSFSAAIPDFENDPFFSAPASSGLPDRPRRLDVALEPSRSRFDSPWVLEPAHVPLQDVSAGPVEIRRIGKAALKGQLTEEFRRRHGIVGVVRHGPWPEEETGFRLELWANFNGGAYNCHLQSNFVFSVALPPGRYDLQLCEMERGYLPHRSVPVESGLVLEENDDLDLRIE
ncbi:MAG: hypothetical protein AB7V22_01530 [Kiritimatiellia bacterium]